MKLKIEQIFKDKYTGKMYDKIGEVLNFTKERGEELLNDPRKLVSEVKEELETASKEPKNVEVPEKKSKKKSK